MALKSPEEHVANQCTVCVAKCITIAAARPVAILNSYEFHYFDAGEGRANLLAAIL